MFWSCWDCIGLLLECFGLCCAALWCVDSCGLYGSALGVFGLLLVCREIAKNNKKCNGYYRIKKKW